jgi:hypothetical protein
MNTKENEGRNASLIVLEFDYKTMVRRLQTRRAPMSFRVCRIAREHTLRCKLAASTTNINGEICIAWRKEHKGTRPEFELVAAVDAERRGLAEFRWRATWEQIRSFWPFHAISIRTGRPRVGRAVRPSS